MRLCDLHCDTLAALFNNGQNITDCNCHVSLKKLGQISPFVQVSAIFSNPSLSDDDCYTRFFEIKDNFQKQIDGGAKVRFCRTIGEIDGAIADGNAAFILAVEDARLLAGDIGRLDALCDAGVRVLTLTWSGSTCIGGSFDTEDGLTPFGKQVVERCFETGIIPDLSHSSRKTADEVLTMAEAAGRPIIASHSDAYAINPHNRNVTDAEFRRITALGGIVGINMYGVHVSSKETCCMEDVIAHIEHYLSLGGEDTIAMGCDFDGIDVSPKEITDVSCLPLLEKALIDRGYSPILVDKIFYANAYRFFEKNFK